MSSKHSSNCHTEEAVVQAAWGSDMGTVMAASEETVATPETNVEFISRCKDSRLCA